jgi:hypothetical protein
VPRPYARRSPYGMFAQLDGCAWSVLIAVFAVPDGSM